MKTTRHDDQTITTHGNAGDRTWRLQPDGRWMWDKSHEYDIEGFEGHTGHQLYLTLATGEVENVYTESGHTTRRILPARWRVTAAAISAALGTPTDEAAA